MRAYLVLPGREVFVDLGREYLVPGKKFFFPCGREVNLERRQCCGDAQLGGTEKVGLGCFSGSC